MDRWRLGGRGEETDSEALRRVIRAAYKVITDDLVRRLLAEIDRESTAGRYTGRHERFADCRTGHLRSLLEAKAREVANIGVFAALLKDLLAHGSVATRAEAEVSLRPPLPAEGARRDRTITAAAELVQYAHDAGWGAVRPAIDADPTFATMTIGLSRVQTESPRKTARRRRGCE